MLKEKFAKNLKYLIGEKSIYSFSKDIDIPHQTIYRYLHCQQIIGLENLLKISDYFGVDLDYLVGRKDF